MKACIYSFLPVRISISFYTLKSAQSQEKEPMRQNDAEIRLKTSPSLRYVHLCMTSDVTAAKELPRSKAGFPFNRLIVPASSPLRYSCTDGLAV